MAGGGKSAGKIVAIVVVLLVVAIAVCVTVTVCCIIRRNKMRKAAQKADAAAQPYAPPPNGPVASGVAAVQPPDGKPVPGYYGTPANPAGNYAGAGPSQLLTASLCA